MSLTIAIIGRPNVGKSTLFNRLTGKQHAIVDDIPGVTRDRREGEGRIGDFKFRLIDTAGLDEAPAEHLAGRMREQTERAVIESDIIIFMFDARTGVTPIDTHFAQWLRKRDTPVVLIANKCEGKSSEAGRIEAFSLGLKEPVAVSAAHGLGMADLYEALLSLDLPNKSAVDTNNLSQRNTPPPLMFAIIGRPNVGKSSLVNQLLGEDRMLTGSEAGITRDAITVPWIWEGRDVRLVDTAGIRRRGKVEKKLEILSIQDSRRAVQFAEVVALILDSTALLERQDLTLARQVIEEGRALIIVVNKWDIAKDRKASLRSLHDRLKTSLPQVRGVPVITCSAKTGEGLGRLMPAVFDLHNQWNRRISTAKLNRWLLDVTEAHPPPVIAGRRLKLRYITQSKSRPPTFIIFSTRAKMLSDTYLRYLANCLREHFDLWGTPLRLLLRQQDNPYA
ncbi:MAG: ribosome biogenesis GTPase Der [Rhodospirillaceae bacterium TMED8]|nr:ribosome biogenesis GTPase Der [Magnetovibrio sp.]OUT50816.1 MAG: ribosome biogenesis GTPase Der [Rhodospirillaceae bacterium TMED8]